MQLAFLIEPK